MKIIISLCKCKRNDPQSLFLNSYGMVPSYYCTKNKTLSLLHAPEDWITYIINHEQIHELITELIGFETSSYFDKLFVKKYLKTLDLIDKYMWEDGTPKFRNL